MGVDHSDPPSFRGAALYYLHDRRLAGEAERLTGERVAWTHICNLPTSDPERAWRMMAHTALAHTALKTAAGVKATGRKLTKPVAAFSLSWHPSERPSRDEMLAAALNSLKALGVADHQAIIVAHDDEPHPHLHVILNRIGESGLAANLGNSRRKLSAWALAYERGRGQIFCHERAVNDERRQGLRPGEPVKRHRRLSRPEYEATIGRSHTEEAARVRADHAELFGEQAASERNQGGQRLNEAARFYRQRSKARTAIGERHAGLAAMTPEAMQTYERIVLILTGPQPELALAHLTQSRSTFTRADLARLIARHTRTAVQFEDIMLRLESSPQIVCLGQDQAGRDRFTTRSHQAIEQRMERHALMLHGQTVGDVMPRWTGKRLGSDQEAALRHMLNGRGLAAVTGFAGSGKSTLLDAARQSWERAGRRVIGMALSGVAADGLKNGAGIDSRTIQSRLYQWERGENMLKAGDVLIVDEAGMIGSRQMERILDHAAAAGAKVVLVGDAEQLQAIEAGGAFKAITDSVGAARLTAVRRQRHQWQQDATRELATGRAWEALRRYEAAGTVHRHHSQGNAMAAAIEAWHRSGKDRPADSQIVLAYTKAEVRALNELARAKLHTDGVLGKDHVLPTQFGPRRFSARVRYYCPKNDRGLGVRNGTLGTVERIIGETMTVRLDGEQGQRVTFKMADYGHIDHGYAATIHKSQGMTVDRTHLLISRNLDRHATYVAMSRHRDRLDVHWSTEAIGSRERLERIVSRESLKDTSLDYAQDKALTAHARRDADDDLRTRIDARAARFAVREKTADGQLANARSLAGKGATPAYVARLTFDAAARSRLFRQLQAALQARLAVALAAGARMKLAWERAARDPRTDLIEFDAETARLAATMRQRHTVEIGNERGVRRRLQTKAAQNCCRPFGMPNRLIFRRNGDPYLSIRNHIRTTGLRRTG
jgi:Ti-type conjugative transfer relaxase TraA